MSVLSHPTPLLPLCTTAGALSCAPLADRGTASCCCANGSHLGAHLLSCALMFLLCLFLLCRVRLIMTARRRPQEGYDHIDATPTTDGRRGPLPTLTCCGPTDRRRKNPTTRNVPPPIVGTGRSGHHRMHLWGRLSESAVGERAARACRCWERVWGEASSFEVWCVYSDVNSRTDAIRRYSARFTRETNTIMRLCFGDVLRAERLLPFNAKLDQREAAE